jgi:hypothetical protein
MIERAAAQIAAGQTLSHQQVKERLAARMKPAPARRKRQAR